MQNLLANIVIEKNIDDNVDIDLFWTTHDYCEQNLGIPQGNQGFSSHHHISQGNAMSIHLFCTNIPLHIMLACELKEIQFHQQFQYNLENHTSLETSYQ
jgi:hypothetical protein